MISCLCVPVQRDLPDFPYLMYHQLGLYASPWAEAGSLTVAQAAQRLELSEEKVCDLLKRNLLPLWPRRLRAVYRIPVEALDHPEVRAAVEAARRDANRKDSPTQFTHPSKPLDTREGGA